MRYVSLFSGIEAASVAWGPLGWEPVCFAELDPFPSAVLAERYPSVPNVGDVTKVNWKRYKGKCDVVVGGSPCQSFSVAGKREGLSGESGLMFEYIRAVREVRPRWFLWENVPGALSSEGGEAFRQLLSEMDALGYGLAWRVLDAQFFGVAQRRERVFLVGRFGTCPPVEVLFEPEVVQWNPAPSREKRAQLAAAAGRDAESAGFKYHQGSGAGGIGYEEEVSPTCTADWHSPAVVTDRGCLNGWDVQSKRVYSPGGVAPTLPSGKTEGMNIQPSVLQVVSAVYPINEQVATRCEKLGRGTGLGIGDDGDPAYTLQAAHPHMVAECPIGMADLAANATIYEDMVGTLHVGGDAPSVCLVENSNGQGIVGALQARDSKGVGSQFVNEDKVVLTTVFGFAQNSRDEVRVVGDGSISGALAAEPGMKQTTYVCETAHSGSNGLGVGESVVRRLTPMECERLQGFPDNWTRIAWRGKPAEECPDGPRYKAIGNSMAVPVMRWIGERIALAEKEEQ